MLLGRPAFDELYRVNVASQLLSVKAALPPLRESRGSVVLTVSTSGFYPGRGGVLYVSSKFAVRGLVVALAHELAPDVRVNGVAPGGTLGTELRGPAALHLDDQRLDDRPERPHAVRRLGLTTRPLRSPLHTVHHRPSVTTRSPYCPSNSRVLPPQYTPHPTYPAFTETVYNSPMSNGIERQYRRRRGIHPAQLVTLAAAALIITMTVSTMTTSGPSTGNALAVAAWLTVAGRVVLAFRSTR